MEVIVDNAILGAFVAIIIVVVTSGFSFAVSEARKVRRARQAEAPKIQKQGPYEPLILGAAKPPPAASSTQPLPSMPLRSRIPRPYSMLAGVILNALNLIFPPVEEHSDRYNDKRPQYAEKIALGSGFSERVGIWKTFRLGWIEGSTHRSYRIEWMQMLAIAAIIAWLSWAVWRFFEWPWMARNGLG